MNAYTKVPAFINRKIELEYLHAHIAKKPESLLFIYGPKSSGKTTLLYKFVDELKKGAVPKYNIKHFNLRTVFLGNYEDFLRAFFGEDFTDNERNDITTHTAEINFNIFRLSKQTMEGLKIKKLDPFVVMQAELERINQSGVRPLIIIDELQALEGIYLNGQRELLKEMFNFFVAMTKEVHLCHVLIASSDGYFLQRIYDDSKLKKTSNFFAINYLTKEDTLYWLNNLRKESAIKEYVLIEPQQEQIWDSLGGSCWEVSNFLGELQSFAKDGRVADEIIENMLGKIKQDRLGTFEFYAKLYEQKIALFVEMAKLIKRNHTFKENDFIALVKNNILPQEVLTKELQELVRQNFIAFNPVTTEFSVQGRSMEIGLAEFAKMQSCT